MRKPSTNSPGPGITAPLGFRAVGGTCGIKKSGAPDLTIIVADGPCAAAGLFTTNRMSSAPVIVGRRHLAKGVARAIVCNSGNANASTGRRGERDAVAMCQAIAQIVGCPATQVLPSSTGIIGRLLLMEKIRPGIQALAPKLSRGIKADADAARGIMTTDLVPKSAHRGVTLGGKRIQLAGICKGSGMIAPNMATMLAFITTDAAISPGALRAALKAAAATTFNRISVDQHTSPSDTLIALASGFAKNPLIKGAQGDYSRFVAALTDLCADMAYQIVKDGEGATKVFRVKVTGARSERDADRIAKAVVDSPLVKTAVHGGDPNWGRVTTAAGYSGAAVVQEKLSLDVGALRVFTRGQPVTLSKPQQRRLNTIMKQKEITFTLHVGLGTAKTQWLGCDLSRQYIAINADYTT